MAIVETRRVTKLFDEVRAVDGIDLVAKEGEFLVLLGPSGCGKTTLMRLIAGLERPTSGDIVIDGNIVTGLPPRARNVAMVFQSYALYPHLTVAKNISFPLRAVGMPKEAIRKKVTWAAQIFGIQGLLDRKPRQLSGGERQRVALARAVVREPVVFLLDEPLSNLDAKLRNSARDELKQFHRSLGTTTIYVTHDQAEAMGLGDRIAVLNQGRVHQIGTPHEIYGLPADTFAATFIGSPPMNLIEDGKTWIGFRPEAFLPKEVEPDDNIVDFPFRITRVEYLGADRLVYGVIDGRTPEAHVISKIPSNVRTHIDAGEVYDFVVRRLDIARFDKESGCRIDGGAT
ncbi:multiple sugar transport system ATP-binding protein [Bradyrhizobium sp. USDA 4524]|uniref:ABC transporter ATP-binding protein n=1 Tax=unclassified Bradyrhizobium TaxID=2631580 RepID=UPI0020A1E800|nr:MULTISPECIES: ABC transporter ATP-binding protein [unclassified Bradyrhizobium]MCP1843687.1 multiple sugar transport system ATP-binding protein [Bradyrhizobium sp. USDA 4538]MCP1904253.1 multiple sugar transport system ATP-binding protein [Bradyrhizobium sp. USDA 4537]MCP1990091.1 multiple sugar transport system ATP-binding protein [Bradyrhizobium sp. USDA 4539]